MRSLTPEEVNEISKRGPIISHVLIQFIAKNRATNAAERLGLWTGDDHQDFTADGETDTYYGAGSIISLSDMENAIGTDVRKYKVTVSNLTPEVQTLIRTYELRGAKVKIFTLMFSPESGLPVTIPRRRFKGWVDRAPITTGAKGGTSSATLELASVSRNLTRTLGARRSNENQKLRNNSDTFLQYISVSGKIQIPWGTGKQIF